MKRKLVWDGERIKESVEIADKKHTPKDILNYLEGVRNQQNQMLSQRDQLEKQLKQINKGIDDARAAEKDLKEFEEKCIELQKEKVKMIINQVHKEVYDKAKRDAEETIAKDPSAYDERQKKQLPYLNYQKGLATHEKMAEKVASGMIREFLYMNPVFENPFK